MHVAPSLRTRYPDVVTIYERLSQLTEMESVQLGFAHQDSLRRRTIKSMAGFDFSLESGLDQLRTCKKLKRLSFFKVTVHCHWMIPKIGRAEVEWIAEHWPELKEIQLNTVKPAKEESEEAKQWRWLKEKRPEIEVRFL